MFFRDKEKEAELQSEVAAQADAYGFSYEIGLKQGGTAGFHMSGFTTEAAADECRKTLIDGLNKAMTEKIIVASANNISVDGADISWFLVRSAEKFEDD